MDWNDIISFLTDKEKIDLIVSYLKFFIVARVAVKREKTSDEKSKVDSNPKS
jgi:hypothetical protein